MATVQNGLSDVRALLKAALTIVDQLLPPEPVPADVEGRRLGGESRSPITGDELLGGAR